jgi:hypothetical protein
MAATLQGSSSKTFFATVQRLAGLNLESVGGPFAERPKRSIRDRRRHPGADRRLRHTQLSPSALKCRLKANVRFGGASGVPRMWMNAQITCLLAPPPSSDEPDPAGGRVRGATPGDGRSSGVGPPRFEKPSDGPRPMARWSRCGLEPLTPDVSPRPSHSDPVLAPTERAFAKSPLRRWSVPVA